MGCPSEGLLLAHCVGPELRNPDSVAPNAKKGNVNRPVFHGGCWGAATLEVWLPMFESAKERKEMLLSHQVPKPE